MTIRTVFFDFGGVLVRTADPTPRIVLAERLGLDVKDLYRKVFDCPASAQASLGKIDEQTLWREIAAGLNWSDDPEALRDQFFSGDVTDLALIDYLRGLRGEVRTGLISNAWPDLRAYIQRQGIDDAFDEMIISAEVGVVKPDARIYQLALERLGADPATSVFVDDMPANVAAAVNLGWRGIVFHDTAETIDAIEEMLMEE